MYTHTFTHMHNNKHTLGSIRVRKVNLFKYSVIVSCHWLHIFIPDWLSFQAAIFITLDLIVWKILCLTWEYQIECVCVLGGIGLFWIYCFTASVEGHFDSSDLALQTFFVALSLLLAFTLLKLILSSKHAFWHNYRFTCTAHIKSSVSWPIYCSRSCASLKNMTLFGSWHSFFFFVVAF